MKISLSFVALVASANATFSPLVDVDTRSLDEIYAAAKKDNGTLQVFWGGDGTSRYTDLGKPDLTIRVAGAAGDEVRTSFAKRFPDVKINLTVELSKYHDNQIDRGWYEGKHVADVAWLQTTHNYPRWKQEGKLVNYKPPTFNDILNGEKDFDGAWMAASLCQSNRGTAKLYDTDLALQLASAKWSTTAPRSTPLKCQPHTLPSPTRSSRASSSSPIPTMTTQSPTSSA